MQIARFTDGVVARLGVVEGDEVVDVLAYSPKLPQDLKAWLPAGSASWSFFRSLAHYAPRRMLRDVSLLAPIAEPSKFLAIGANYLCHLAEVAHLGLKAAPCQIWFNKQVSCINGPFADVRIPAISDQVDYEAELGVVIGKRACNVSAEQALDYVGGYLVCNDVSVRDIQLQASTMTLGKSFDTHGPIGPWLVTADEVPDPQNLTLRAFVNGEPRQKASTSTMIHSVAFQIAYLSEILTLEPGDILSTGTPAGVALGMRPPRYLVRGDRVRVQVDELGAIENTFI